MYSALSLCKKYYQTKVKTSCNNVQPFTIRHTTLSITVYNKYCTPYAGITLLHAIEDRQADLLLRNTPILYVQYLNTALFILLMYCPLTPAKRSIFFPV